jgi:hypothetical protein
MLPRVRTWLVAGASSLALIVSGCNSGGSDDSRISRTTASATPASGRVLTADPAPLTPADLKKVGVDKPAGVVLSAYYWAQWGSLPNVVALYDSRVRDAFGSPGISDAYQDQRDAILHTQPRVKDVTRARRGIVVTVEGWSKGAPPSHDSFLLSRHGGRYYILHDTLLERGLSAVAGARASRNLTGKQAIQAANKAGGAAARRYRNLTLK